MLLLFFSGVNGFFYPLIFRWWNFSFTSTLRYIFPTCGKFLRYATLLRLLASFHFCFSSFLNILSTWLISHSSNQKERRGGRGDLGRQRTRFWGKTFIFWTFNSPFTFFLHLRCYTTEIARICLYSTKYLLSK